MKLAGTRAGLWFFGTIIFVMFFFSSVLDGKSLTEQIVQLIFFGFLAAGAAFFWTWHQVAEDERQLEIAERRKAIERDSSDTT